MQRNPRVYRAQTTTVTVSASFYEAGFSYTETPSQISWTITRLSAPGVANMTVDPGNTRVTVQCNSYAPCQCDVTISYVNPDTTVVTDAITILFNNAQLCDQVTLQPSG